MTRGRTNVFSAGGGRAYPVCPSFDAVLEGEVVVVLADDLAAGLLDALDGALAGARGDDVYRC